MGNSTHGTLNQTESRTSMTNLFILAHPKTVEVVRSVAKNHSIENVKTCTTVRDLTQELVQKLNERQKCVVVSGLGNSSKNKIFDSNNWGSSLLELTNANQIPVIIYSHTASRNEKTQAMCMQRGAFSVVSCRSELEKCFHSIRGVKSKDVLCIAGDKTYGETLAVCDSLGFRVTRAMMVSKAKKALDSGNFFLVVAALGIDDDTMIFDLGGDRSSLMDLAKEKTASFVVYSHTATLHADYAQACHDAGAHFVCNSPNMLGDFINRLLAELPRQEQMDIDSPKVPIPTQKPEDYVLIKRRYNRDEQLEKAKIKGSVIKTSKSVTSAILKDLRNLGEFGLAVPSSKITQNTRFVSISDTHMSHRRLSLPDGDVLIHTGDFCANYGSNADLKAHLKDFVRWLHEISSRYALIVFIAGNHDTILDGECYDDDYARNIIQNGLPNNTVYLENSSVEFRGLKIHGLPFTQSRVEEMGKRYYSDAFERKKSDRKKLYKEIPDDTDILLTHVPAVTGLGSSQILDSVLLERMQQLNLVAFQHGHDHQNFGVRYYDFGGNTPTLCINSAQEHFFRIDKHCGGFPWIWDIVRAH